MTKEEFQSWVRSEEWYQTIELSDGLTTRGSVDSRERLQFLERNIDVKGKRVIDIGCNSGAYCFWAKKNGAREVIGVDVTDKRIQQAKKIAEHEKLDITFLNKGIADIAHLGSFDVVMCFAVLTEVPDLLGALSALKTAVGGVGLIELSLAKPIGYISRSKNFLRGYGTMPRRKAVLELRKHKHGWMIDPSIDVMSTVLGDELKVTDMGPSVRYQMVKLERVEHA